MTRKYLLPLFSGTTAMLALMAGVASAQDAGPNLPPPPPDGGADMRPDQPGNGPQQQPGRPGLGRPGMPNPHGMPGMPGGMARMAGGMPPAMHPNGPVSQIEVTYLGLEASPVDPALRAQTKLPQNGAGLVVNFVDSEGPAAKADLQQYDILTKLDDQLLVNPPQLQSLIRLHREGDEVKLTLIRAGETKTVTAKLGKKQVPDFEGAFSAPGMMHPGFHPGFGPGGGIRGPEMLGGGRPDFGGQTSVKARAISYRDSEMTLNVSEQSGKLVLDAKDPSGKSLFNGSIETADDRNAVPADVRKRLDTLVWANFRQMAREGSAPRGEVVTPSASPK